MPVKPQDYPAYIEQCKADPVYVINADEIAGGGPGAGNSGSGAPAAYMEIEYLGV